MTCGSGEMVREIAAEFLSADTASGQYASYSGSAYMPSLSSLNRLMKLIRVLFFPEYFSSISAGEGRSLYAIGALIERIESTLSDQLSRGIAYNCKHRRPYDACRHESKLLVEKFIRNLPDLRNMLLEDVRAAYDGDPAARSVGEIVFAYPSIHALVHYRVAHALYTMDVPIIPRIIGEMAHSKTGIDIHPGAKIGNSFFMDHGTGIVIGETSVIGDRVRLYQGVTLGAKRFSKNRDGTLVKGEARHPVVGDDVVIYAGATVLGRVRIGEGAVIGGNIWVTEDVAPGTRLLQRKPRQIEFINGEGI